MSGSGRLTTHVLDTASGQPAAGVGIVLWRLRPGTGDGVQRELLATTWTNGDGRTDRPLLEDGALEAGVYELVFAVGDYFASRDPNRTVPPFLDEVPVRFGIADPCAHYHVPLLVSLWSYTTYRGS
jgi:5-hydroxyisourate hydrolase